MAIVQDGPAANLRKRKSLNPTTAAAGPVEGQEDIADGKTNAGGITSGESLAVLRHGGIPTEHGQEIDRQMDEHEEYEFGGPVGTTAMMVIFPVLMYYLWICLWYYQGSFVYPKNVDDIQPFMSRMWAHVLDGAYPTAFAWKSYLGLTVVQLLFAAFLPGIQQNGLPVPSLDYAALPYLCNALSSWYVTLITTGVLHYTGIYRLPWIIEHVGELMTVAIITSYACTLIIYWGAIFFNYGGRPIRMSGYFLYDVFMGASLNPRLGPVDLKMFAEVRVPWVLLFLLGLSGAVKQWEDTGRVTYNAAHYLLAIGLYMNACAKGEHYIPQTWDMFHEKFGWMLIFWNMAGVPFTYCYPVIYMMRAPSASYEFSLPVNIAMFLTLITCYIIFDGSMAQKSAFKLQQQGDFVPRGAFPQVPWSVVKNPTYVQTKHGNKLLTGGWWQFARKINYTSDWIQSVTWGLTGGLNTIITMWYPIFFLAVLVHRCERDFKKCSRKYGEDWDEYCRIVKYKFIPGVY